MAKSKKKLPKNQPSESPNPPPFDPDNYSWLDVLESEVTEIANEGHRPDRRRCVEQQQILTAALNHLHTFLYFWHGLIDTTDSIHWVDIHQVIHAAKVVRYAEEIVDDVRIMMHVNLASERAGEIEKQIKADLDGGIQPPQGGAK